MSLTDWLKYGWLSEHKATANEIRDLFALVDRDLTDCQVEELSSDWKLNIAYNAVLQSAVGALAAAGYRASRDAHHYRVLQSLAFTIALPPGDIARLDLFRKKRNRGGYERAGMVSETETREMVELAREIAAKVRRWLAEYHPDLTS